MPTLLDRLIVLPAEADVGHHQIERARSDPSLLEVEDGGYLALTAEDVVREQITVQDALRKARWDTLAQCFRLPSQHPGEGRPIVALLGEREHALEELLPHSVLAREAIGARHLVHPGHDLAQTAQRCCIAAEVTRLEIRQQSPGDTIALSVSRPGLQQQWDGSGDSVLVYPDMALYHALDILDAALGLPQLQHQPSPVRQLEPEVGIVPATG